MDETDEIERLFRSEYGRLCTALGATFGHENAADAIQEAFIAAHSQWSKISGHQDPAGWIRRVAINRLLNAKRNSARRESILQHWRPGSDRASEPVAVEQPDLSEALSQLPERTRVAVCLYYIGDLSIAQVADAMGTSTGAVKSTLHRGRSHLKAKLLGADHG